MAYRAAELEVPSDDPFKNDRLSRKDAVVFLANLIERAGGPFVVAVDGPWGTGKSTFIRMLQAELGNATFQCVNFNAWEVDYVTDPLVAMVSTIDQIALTGQNAATFKEHLKKVRKVTTLVAKRGAVAAVKALTVGALDLQEEVESAISEFASESLSDIVEAFQKEKELLAQFRAELEAAIKQLPTSGKKSTLVFFVDELDRCRPTFAIELLERVKHLFNVDNIIFVLAIDKAQLESSTAAVYGSGINAAEYLRRFIDIDFAIPATTGDKHTEGLMSSFGLDDDFAERGTHGTLRYDRDNFVDYFTALAEMFRLSLRARERCFTRMRLVMDQTPSNHYLDPILVALLIVLRAKDPRVYGALVGGEVSAQEMMQHLARIPGGATLVEGRMGLVLEAYLMAADENSARLAQRRTELTRVSEDDGAAADVREHAQSLIEMCRQVPGAMRGRITVRSIARKIDLAANVRD